MYYPVCGNTKPAVVIVLSYTTVKWKKKNIYVFIIADFLVVSLNQ